MATDCGGVRPPLVPERHPGSSRDSFKVIRHSHVEPRFPARAPAEREVGRWFDDDELSLRIERPSVCPPAACVKSSPHTELHGPLIDRASVECIPPRDQFGGVRQCPEHALRRREDINAHDQATIVVTFARFHSSHLLLEVPRRTVGAQSSEGIAVRSGPCPQLALLVRRRSSKPVHAVHSPRWT